MEMGGSEGCGVENCCEWGIVGPGGGKLRAGGEEASNVGGMAGVERCRMESYRPQGQELCH